MNWIDEAKNIVREYVEAHIDRSNPQVEYSIFVVWQAKTLQNFKCLISTTMPDGLYFELTYDGDMHRWYLDVYSKVENRVIAYERVHEQPDP